MGVREQIQRERERLRAKRKARSDKHWAEWNERAKREANARLFECRGRAAIREALRRDRLREAETMRPADPAPRYDEVFEEGTRALNEG